MVERLTWIVEAAVAAQRSRYSWNERLIHWEKPPSDHEEGKIQRAASIATALVMQNQVLLDEGVSVRPQGSYYNNTNVRLEADMDLRVQLPDIYVQYAEGIDREVAASDLGYVDTGRTFQQIAKVVRDELAADCRRLFGNDAVTVGNKAITVEGLTTSRADVDLVPAFHFHWIVEHGRAGFETIPGIAIFGVEGPPILNFPELHHRNGIDKRNATQHRFKKVVRMLKRLNYELVELGVVNRRIPSFLVECLVYAVENSEFLHNEDRYGRLNRVVARIYHLVHDEEWTKTATEINGWKFLFHPAQAWTVDDARNFIAAALVRLAN